MRFDLFFEMAMPDFLRRSEQQTYRDCMQQVVLAETLGFRCAWFVEHHFTEHYSHLSKPDLLIAALSQHTSAIRLGLGVIPLPYHHAIHVAERVATLDILTAGRLDVGIGRGYAPKEYEIFGAEMQNSRAMVAESLAILRNSFLKQPFSFAGQFYNFANLQVLPRGVQTPHPPLWGAAVSPESFVWAAQESLNVLVGPFKPWFMIKHDIAQYTQAAQDRPGAIGLTLGVVCLPEKKRAKAHAAQAFNWFYSKLYENVLPVLEKHYPSYAHFSDLGRFRQLLKHGAHLALLETFGMVVVGDAQTCIAALQKYKESGVSHILCAFGAGALPHDVTQESMQYFAQEVLPAFS